MGLGFEEDGKARFDFQRTDFNTAWQPAPEVFPYQTEIQSQYKGSNVSFSTEVVNRLMARSNPFFYATTNNNLFFGGGRGEAFRRNADLPVDVKCSGNAECEITDWNDFDNDRKIDWGEWVDSNGNGIIDAGIDTTGSCLQLDDDEECELTKGTGNMDKYFLTVTNDQGGKSKSVEVKPSGSLSGELANKSYPSPNGNNDIKVKRCEWNDKNFDRSLSNDEITWEASGKSDLWALRDNASAWELVEFDGEPFSRAGAIGFSISNNAYLFGGAGAGIGFADEYKGGNNGSNFELLTLDGDGFAAIHGFHFILNNRAYFGGGESDSGNIQSLNMRLFNPAAGEVEQVIGCGLNTLTRGVAFSANNKGFIGIGRITSGMGGLTDELWMYFPSN